MERSRLASVAQRIVGKAAERRNGRSAFLELADGLRLHYLDLAGGGPGPTVVLAHGLGGSALGFWRVAFPLAAGVGRVVAADMPGAGLSPNPPGGPPGFEGVNRAFTEFVERVVPEPAVYVGHSLGGAMVMRYLARRPERAIGTALVAPAGARVAPARLAALVEGFQVATLREAAALSRRFFSDPPAWLPLVMGPTTLFAMRQPHVRKMLEEALRVSALEDAELERLPLPLLLLWARNERVLPYEAVEHFRAHLPRGAEIEEVHDFGHSPQLDRPARLAERLLRFVRETVASNRPAWKAS